jgi:hypothetical protein
MKLIDTDSELYIFESILDYVIDITSIAIWYTINYTIVS